MGTLKVKPSLSYHNYKRDNVESFAVAVRDGIFENGTVFPTPPITQSDCQTLIDDFINKYGAYQFGGRSNKGPYQAAYASLIVGLDSLAGYVNTVAAGDANKILMSGFIPTKGISSAINPPAVPATPMVKRGITGVLIAEVEVVAGAEFYGCIVILNQIKPDYANINGTGQLVLTDDGSNPPPPPPSVSGVIFDFNKSRKKTFINLQVGFTYYFYFYAINANGVSQLSNGAALMCA